MFLTAAKTRAFPLLAGEELGVGIGAIPPETGSLDQYPNAAIKWL
jgi:hypothetical protein